MTASRSSLGALAVCLAAGLLGAGCSDESGTPDPARKRSNVVTASPSATASAPATSGASSARPPKRARLCGDHQASGAPKTEPKTAAAPGAASPPPRIPFGAGKWVWLNLWAAWCGPCKDEIPLVRRFEADLRKAGASIDVAFVSLDDDERELGRFLAAQPEGGMRSSYWLPEGGDRKSFLGSLGIGDATALPIHALFDPKGELACFVNGVIEPGDYEAIAKLVGAR